MRMKHNSWAIPFLEEHPETVITLDSLKDDEMQAFIDHKPIYMEIGTGKGDFILGMAKKNPEINFLGVEVSAMALGFCAKKIVEEDLKNVKLINIDVHYLLQNLPKHHFAGIFLNFSDPWPKKRHTKRRLTYPSILKEYARIIEENGCIYQKTDNKDLFDYSLESYNETNWLLKDLTYDFQTSEFDVPTEYETKFRAIGKPICRVIAVKGDKTDEIE